MKEKYGRGGWWGRGKVGRGGKKKWVVKEVKKLKKEVGKLNK